MSFLRVREQVLLPGRVLHGQFVRACGLVCPAPERWRPFHRERALVGVDGQPVTVCAAVPYRMEGYADRLARLFTVALLDLRAAPGLPRAALHLVLPTWMQGHPELGHMEDALAKAVAVAGAGEEWRPRLRFGDAAEALSVVGHAAAAVANNETDAVIVGAADSLVHPAVLDRLALENRVLCRNNPNGAVPGEAACLVHLAAAGAGPRPLGDMLAAFRGREPEDVREPAAVVGRGLAAAFRQAGEYAPAADRLLSDMNSERWRAEEFGFAVSGAGGAPAGAVGPGGGAGPSSW